MGNTRNWNPLTSLCLDEAAAAAVLAGGYSADNVFMFSAETGPKGSKLTMKSPCVSWGIGYIENASEARSVLRHIKTNGARVWATLNGKTTIDGVVYGIVQYYVYQ